MSRFGPYIFTLVFQILSPVSEIAKVLSCVSRSPWPPNMHLKTSDISQLCIENVLIITALTVWMDPNQYRPFNTNTNTDFKIWYISQEFSFRHMKHKYLLLELNLLHCIPLWWTNYATWTLMTWLKSGFIHSYKYQYRCIDKSPISNF